MGKTDEKVYLGKVLRKLIKTQDGREVEINKFLVDNPLPKNKDGSTNKYFKGQLIWRDANGNEFLVKQGTFNGVSDIAANAGFTRSLAIDLTDSYSVEKIVK